ncbi:MAG: double-strand break repair protein AddB, partial [Geminicoccaceae bacterium]|nr:double-strand break repair protein AddB [Geminicoccaceae bacterium]
DAALAGLERIEAPDFATEALTIALRMREALDAPGRTVALVTGDRTLGRRVAIELGRFGVDIDDTAGTPLDQSPPGSFLLLAARAVIDGLQPVPLLSLLKHPLARGGTEDGAFRRQVRAFERTVLRGPRTAGGFDGLRRALEAAHARKRPPQPPEGLRDWLAAIEEAAAPLDRLAGAGEATFAELVEAHLAFAQWLARDAQGRPDALWAREAGEAAATFMADLAEAARDFPPVAVTAYPALLAVLMGAQSVRPQAGRHPRAAILGQLESRLMSADRMLIAGLNEGVWPQRPDPSPWVNRAMRTALGLPPVEQRIGIAAHDLVMAACAPEVVLSRARKDAAGAPTTASRWLLRLQAVLEATGDKERIDADPCWAAWAASLDRPAAPPSPCPRPVPCPPLKTRPNEASVTEIETLIRDPYAFYARRILGLDALDALDEEPGAAERGTVIHAALEDFVRAWPGQLPHDALERLLEAGRKRFEEVGHHPQVRAIWWPRFLDIADWFIEQEKVRRSTAQRIMAESRGRLEIDTGTGKFLLKARADRVEIGADGGLAIIDYKTGNPPKPRDVAAGISPQLTLTGLIARGGGFAGAAGEVREALYWALGGGHKGSKSTDAGGDVASLEELVEEAGAGVARLIDWFRDPANGYPAVPRPEIAPVWSDYEHLARIDEWRGTATSTTEPESDAATAEAGT